MNMEKFEKANAIYLRIRKLDNEIVAIKKVAQQLVAGTELVVDMKCEKVTAKANLVGYELAEMGFHGPVEIIDMLRNRMISPTAVQPHPNILAVKQTLEDTEGLVFLDALVRAKYAKRDLLVKQLQELGF